MHSRPATSSPSTEHPNSIFSTDRSKEFVRQQGLKEKDEMCPCCQIQQESQAAATDRSPARERAPTGRADTSFGKQSQQITSNTWLPRFSPSATSSSREAASHLFFPWALCPSAVYSLFLWPCKEWDLWFWDKWILVICSGVAWPALKFSLDNLCAHSCPCTVVSKVTDKYSQYLTDILTWNHFGNSALKQKHSTVHTEHCLGTADTLL